jgi:hypothetical protein
VFQFVAGRNGFHAWMVFRIFVERSVEQASGVVLQFSSGTERKQPVRLNQPTMNVKTGLRLGVKKLTRNWEGRCKVKFTSR